MRKWLDSLLHVLGGGAITAAGVLLGIPGWLCLITVGAGGWLREVVQAGSFDLSDHKEIEAIAWSIGSAAAWWLVWWLT